MMQTTVKNMLDFIQFNAPTQEQKTVINALQLFVQDTNEQDFFVLCGSAGTGKSSIMNAVVQYGNVKGYSIQIAAPTGRAARIIAGKTKADTTTLHSLLFNVENNEHNAAVKYCEKVSDNDKFTIFIIDEASMVGSQLIRNDSSSLFQCDTTILDAIVKYVKSGNKNNKVIFVGDRYQLPPIMETDSNALYPNYLKTKYHWQGTHFELTEVKRQNSDSYILNKATICRNEMMAKKEKFDYSLPSYGNMFTTIPIYIKALKSKGPTNSIAIAKTHTQCKIFNTKVREKLFGHKANNILQHNDVIVIKRNWKGKEIKLYNGDIAIVKDIAYANKTYIEEICFVPIKLRVKDEKNKELIINELVMLDTLYTNNGNLSLQKENALFAHRMKHNPVFRKTKKIQDDKYLSAIRASYGYCVTCNTAQGGEWDDVYLNNFSVPSPKWFYTAVTRAKENIFAF
jgi:exodeoxyribonuclease-5